MGIPTAIKPLEMLRPDGSKFNRPEMEAQIRESWKGHQPKRLKAIDPYNLSPKIAYDTPSIVVLHWLLDEMTRRGEIDGKVLGINIPAPGHFDPPDTFNQFKQLLLLAIEEGIALHPQDGEGINMSEITVPPQPANGVPPNGQSNIPYTPPAAPPMAQAPAAQAPAAQGSLFPKENPDRIWGKAFPPKKRRTKQEQGEDNLWEKLGKPEGQVTFAPFEQVYGITWAKARKENLIGDGTEFQLPPTTTGQAQDMNPPLPPQAPAFTPPAAPPQAAAPMAPAPPMAPGAPGMAPPGVASPPGVPVPGIPQAHPHAPAVPPPPGQAAAPGAPMAPQAPPMAPQAPSVGAPPPMAPPPMAPQAPQAAAPAPAVDLTEVLAGQARLSKELAVINAGLAFTLRSQYQKAGPYTLESILGELGVNLPQ